MEKKTIGLCSQSILSKEIKNPKNQRNYWMCLSKNIPKYPTLPITICKHHIKAKE